MAGSLAAGFARPEFFPVLRGILVWLVPVWIGVLFVVQALATPDATGSTALDSWSDRLRGRKWTCPGCGVLYRWNVPICGDCGVTRPEADDDGRPWRCEVCEADNEPHAIACARCTVPRPKASP